MAVELEETYGYKLAESREAAGYTQTQFAERINRETEKTYQITVGLIQKWEANKVVPNDKLLAIISEVLAEKLNLKDKAKQTFIKELKDAANLTREALAAGDSIEDASQHFGAVLKRDLEEAHLDEQGLSELIRAKGEPVRDWSYVHRVESGREEPTPAFKTAAEKVLAQKSLDSFDKSKFLSYIYNTLGEETLRKIQHCGEAAIKGLRNGGWAANSKLYVALSNGIKKELEERGILDGNGRFTEGMFKGQDYQSLVTQAAKDPHRVSNRH